jgi:hypothetical protein
VKGDDNSKNIALLAADASYMFTLSKRMKYLHKPHSVQKLKVLIQAQLPGLLTDLARPQTSPIYILMLVAA